MYHCGPTVYDYVHIGNLRSWTTADILRRTFEYTGYSVKQVINITDIGHLSGGEDEGEDKMTKGLKREGKPLTLEAMKELADFYTESFKKDLVEMNILAPHSLPKASEHIAEDINLIKTLEEKGFAYKTSDGIYFDTGKDPHYGKLGGNSDETDEHSRIGINSEKKNSRDFALWKINPELGFGSPWGKGFPGWHIECSAMARKYLGNHFDIHTGGIDLAPIHHNNEIAQSENACECQFVNYWLHNAFVNVENDKMAKSEGNFITLKTLSEKKFLPLAYRYWLLQARYSSPINFSFEALESAQTAYLKIIKFWKTLPDGGKINEGYKKNLIEAMEDDLDTPKSIALLWELIKDDRVSVEDKKTTIGEFDKLLGLGIEGSANKLEDVSTTNLPENIQNIINKREDARKNKDWKTSDKLRDELKSLGYAVEDLPEGPRVSL